jgi:hypothetical protein
MMSAHSPRRRHDQRQLSRDEVATVAARGLPQRINRVTTATAEGLQLFSSEENTVAMTSSLGALLEEVVFLGGSARNGMPTSADWGGLRPNVAPPGH